MNRNPDDEYDRLRDDADCGRRCPTCMASGVIAKSPTNAKPFKCLGCGFEWASWDDRMRVVLCEKVTA